MTTNDRIEREVIVAASPERVWRALTTRDGLASWFGDSAEIDLRPGGSAIFGWSEYGGAVAAVVEVVEPPERFAFRWATGFDTSVEDGPSTLVEFSLEPVAEGTRLRVVESGFADLPADIRDSQLDDNSTGWEAELDDLVEHLSSREAV